MRKLLVCGQWSWREDEVSLKQFQQLNREDKEEYLVLLAGLKLDEQSTGDKYLLNTYGKKHHKKDKGFLSLED